MLVEYPKMAGNGFFKKKKFQNTFKSKWMKHGMILVHDFIITIDVYRKIWQYF